MDSPSLDGAAVAATEGGMLWVYTSHAGSASSPGRTYKVEVNLDTGLARCECDGYRYRDRCRHIEEARADILRVNYGMRLAAALSGTASPARIAGKIVLL